ncbi:MAG: TolC family protein [Polyangiales bacterium]
MRQRLFGRAIVASTLTLVATATPSLRAETNDVSIPASLSLEKSLELFHTHGYDLLIADAAVYSAEADVSTAGAIANPSVTGIYGRIIDPKYSTGDCATCSKNSYTFGLGDNGALFDTLSDKRGLRLSVARKALQVVKLGRQDLQRQLDLQVKQAYVAFAAATFALDFAKEVQASAQKTLEVNKARFPGKIDEGALARIETAKLESDRQVDLAQSNVKIARVGLSYLLGVRGKIPTFGVAGKPLEFTVPSGLGSTSEEALLQKALAHRPDLAAGKVEKERAEDSLSLAKRLRFPDVQLMVQYNQIGTGQNAVQPPTVSFGVTVTLPTFYQHQGEIKKAQSDIYLGTVTVKKLEAKVASEVSAAFETYATQKKVVERMEGELLGRAKKARDITEAQFNEGKALLTDMLDAQRTYIATNLEYVDDLATYWNAIFAL